MLTKLKDKVQKILTIEAKKIRKAGFTANHISFIGIILAIFSTLAYLNWENNKLYLLVAIIFLLLSGLCDVLDGIVARLHSGTTDFGGFFDSLLDRYSDVLIYTGIILSGLCEIHWGLFAIIGSVLVSYSRSKAELIGIKMETVGIAERAERLIIILITSLIAFLWEPKIIMNIGIITLAILTNLTVLHRAVYVYKKIKIRN